MGVRLLNQHQYIWTQSIRWSQLNSGYLLESVDSGQSSCVFDLNLSALPNSPDTLIY